MQLDEITAATPWDVWAVAAVLVLILPVWMTLGITGTCVALATFRYFDRKG